MSSSNAVVNANPVCYLIFPLVLPMLKFSLPPGLYEKPIKMKRILPDSRTSHERMHACAPVPCDGVCGVSRHSMSLALRFVMEIIIVGDRVCWHGARPGIDYPPARFHSESSSGNFSTIERGAWSSSIPLTPFNLVPTCVCYSR